MRKPWKQTVSTVVLTAALLSTAYPAFALEGRAAAAVQAPVSYQLTEGIEVEVKSLLNEKSATGTRLGAVIRMKNTSGRLARVPEYELRLKTAAGVEYRLTSSAANVKSIQPKSQAELSYLTTIDSTEAVQVSELSWVDVDVYVYPKKETVKLTLPAGDYSWNGSDGAPSQASQVVKWGEPFVLSSLQSPLVYEPAGLTYEYGETKATAVVKILVSNPTDKRQSAPNITLEGKLGKETYDGSLAEANVTLEPGEKKYIHFLVPTNLNTELDALNVVTKESFVGDDKALSTYNVGRVHILLPGGTGETVGQAEEYFLGEPMRLDPLNKLVHPNMSVSLVEMHMQENDGDGFNTAIAKFKLTNQSSRPLAVPALQTDLVSGDGYTYTGMRQNSAALRILPGASYTVSYSYVLPASETGENLKLSLFETLRAGGVGTEAAGTFKSKIAAYEVPVQENSNSKNELKLYPLTVKVQNWNISAIYNPQQNYVYSLKMLLDIEQDQQVVVDNTFSHLRFELYDTAGSLIGTSTNALSGANKLQKGYNTIYLNSNSQQLDFPVTMKVYEAFVNEKGEVSKRLLTTWQQR